MTGHDESRSDEDRDRITRLASWTAVQESLITDLIELEQAGALDHVRRYVARLLAVQHGQAAPPRPRASDGPEVLAYWDALHKDLAELDLRDALGGIRVIITERLRQVREGIPGGSLRAMIELGIDQATYGHGGTGDITVAAALLAAEIDRQEAGT